MRIEELRSDEKGAEIMKPSRYPSMVWVITISLVAWLGGSGVSLAQTFTSGSTGALGAFAPATNTAVTLPADGVLNYTTVTIPAGVTVTFVKNAANTPVVMLATGDVLVNGTLSVDGGNGAAAASAPGPQVSAGGQGGPGGFRGGNGQSRDPGILAQAGQGPGGGTSAPAGQFTGGYGAYGGPPSFISLIPLIGGSGGGGGGSVVLSGNFPVSGGAGGGGGGAIVVASSTKITVSGAGIISANGGNGTGTGAGCGVAGGSGSGGAVRLVAPQITGNGSVTALTPAGAGCLPTTGGGKIRIETFTNTFSGTTNPQASLTASTGPVTGASNPALINMPALAITTVGGIAVPSVPTGSFTTADVSLPAGTTNPVPVVLTAVNTPLNTTFSVRLIPVGGTATSVNASAPSGTPSLSTASANVTFTSGIVSVLNAFASLIITAGLFPSIDGEEVDRVLMAAEMSQPSTLTLVTKSGRELLFSELSETDQLKVAMAFEAMRNEER